MGGGDPLLLKNETSDSGSHSKTMISRLRPLSRRAFSAASASRGISAPAQAPSRARRALRFGARALGLTAGALVVLNPWSELPDAGESFAPSCFPKGPRNAQSAGGRGSWLRGAPPCQGLPRQRYVSLYLSLAPSPHRPPPPTTTTTTTLPPLFPVGIEKNFYEHRFLTDKDPDDLASFYGSEEFMDLFCVLPFMGTLMMRGGTFDDE